LERGKRPKKLNVFAQITGFLSFRLQIPDGHGNLQAVGKCLFAKARLAALTDGVFSVTMTLLVFDVRLPEDSIPLTTAELLQGLAKLLPSNQFVSVELTYRDGSVSEVRSFRR
jgi:hypothetical protein